jgi:hypothetical protein
VHDIDEFKAVLTDYLFTSAQCRQGNEHEVEMQQLRKELELLKWEKGELLLAVQEAARGVGMCHSPIRL